MVILTITLIYIFLSKLSIINMYYFYDYSKNEYKERRGQLHKNFTRVTEK